jgi:hypothetical protein
MTPSPHLHAGSVVERTPGQLAGDIDDQVVLLSLESGTYFLLNAVASRIWSLIERPATAGALVDRLLDEFDVDRETCDRAVVDFLRALAANGLIRVDH